MRDRWNGRGGICLARLLVERKEEKGRGKGGEGPVNRVAGGELPGDDNLYNGELVIVIDDLHLWITEGIATG